MKKKIDEYIERTGQPKSRSRNAYRFTKLGGGSASSARPTTSREPLSERLLRALFSARSICSTCRTAYRQRDRCARQEARLSNVSIPYKQSRCTQTSRENLLWRSYATGCAREAHCQSDSSKYRRHCCRRTAATASTVFTAAS